MQYYLTFQGSSNQTWTVKFTLFKTDFYNLIIENVGIDSEIIPILLSESQIVMIFKKLNDIVNFKDMTFKYFCMVVTGAAMLSVKWCK